MLRRGTAGAAPYVLVSLVCALVVVGVMQVQHADLSVPLAYTRTFDLLAVLGSIKSVIENGTYLENCRLAAPGCQYHYDFPIADAFHFHAIAWLSRIVGNMFLAVNLYFLAGPALAGIIALFVLRRFGIGRLTASAVAILYGFLPWYFLQGMSHYSLSLYALCPFCMLFCRQILDPAGNRALVFRREGRLVCCYRELALGIAVCALLAFTNIYYSFFFCSLMLSPPR